jgi:DNA-directed RNA polymerase specialized sigma24 family protein
MLGSLTEADDAVQDAWLRLSRSGPGGVENLGGWLTTIVARVCLNVLRSRNVRHEESYGCTCLTRSTDGTNPSLSLTLAKSIRCDLSSRPG